MYQRIYLSCLLFSFFAVQAQITPDFNVITPCIGIDTRLVSNSTSIDNIVAINWDLDNDSTFNDTTGVQAAIKVDSSGTIRIGIEVITDIDDTAFIYKDVFIGPKPIAAFNVKGNCLDFPATFINTSSVAVGAISNAYWDFGNEEYSLLSGDNIHTYEELGTYNTSLIVMSDLGCKDTATLSVEVNPSIYIDIVFPGDSIVKFGVPITVSTSNTYDTVNWNESIVSASYEVSDAGSYSVYVVDDNGCSAEKIFAIKKFDATVNLPNVITPNEDNINETWDISPVIEAYGVCSVNIYDKTGNLVYESASYDNLWSGTFGGGVLPSGVYYYAITANSGDFSTNGSINLLK
jgi:gliding motility-associated-like protein